VWKEWKGATTAMSQGETEKGTGKLATDQASKGSTKSTRSGQIRADSE
jgi:hypothetical protein